MGTIIRVAQEFRVDPENSLAWVKIAQSARFSNHVLTGVSDPAEGSNFAQVNSLYPPEHAPDWHRSYLDAASSTYCFGPTTSHPFEWTRSRQPTTPFGLPTPSVGQQSRPPHRRSG